MKTYGVVMMTSASTRCFSKAELGPSLSEVVTSSWPLLSTYWRMPSSFSVQPSSRDSSLACCPAFFAFPVSLSTSRALLSSEALGLERRHWELVRRWEELDLHRTGPAGPCPVGWQRQSACGPRQSVETTKEELLEERRRRKQATRRRGGQAARKRNGALPW